MVIKLQREQVEIDLDDGGNKNVLKKGLAYSNQIRPRNKRLMCISVVESIQSG